MGVCFGRIWGILGPEAYIPSAWGPVSDSEVHLGAFNLRASAPVLRRLTIDACHSGRVLGAVASWHPQLHTTQTRSTGFNIMTFIWNHPKVIFQ